MKTKRKDLRCQGKNRKNKTCNTLLYRYSITEDEISIEIKCPICNSFNILKLPFKKNGTEKHFL